jgi:hypothetical protein
MPWYRAVAHSRGPVWTELARSSTNHPHMPLMVCSPADERAAPKPPILEHVNTRPDVISADLLARLAARQKVLVIHHGSWAFVFEDDCEVYLGAYRRSGEEYELMFDQVDSGLPNDRPPYHGGWVLVPSTGMGFAWSLGHTQQPAVTIEYLGETYDVHADASGYWAFIRGTADDGPYETPEVVAS